jgi:hypothetical protein
MLTMPKYCFDSEENRAVSGHNTGKQPFKILLVDSMLHTSPAIVTKKGSKPAPHLDPLYRESLALLNLKSDLRTELAI